MFFLRPIRRCSLAAFFRSLRRGLEVSLFVAAFAFPARANDQDDAMIVLAEASATIASLRKDPDQGELFASWLSRARAVLIVPNYYKGGLIVGGSYGNGILMARDNSGSFSPPAFYRLVGGSLGLQIGGQRAQMIYLIMTEKGLDAILSDQFKIGATVGVSMAHLGAGIESGTTTNLSKDILSLSTSQGAYGGVSLEGATITFRESWNRAVYGPRASARAILFDRRWTLPEAIRLHNALYAAGAQGNAVIQGEPDPAAALTSPSGTASTSSGITEKRSLRPLEGGAGAPVRIVPSTGTDLQ